MRRALRRTWRRLSTNCSRKSLLVPSSPLVGHRTFSSSFTVTANDVWEQEILEWGHVRVQQEIRVDEATELGLGAVVWHAALVFNSLIEEKLGDTAEQFFRDKKVLELGAGCGATGLLLASKGADVTLTDVDVLVPHLRRNVELNGKTGIVGVRALRWEDAVQADFAAPSGAEGNEDVSRGLYDVVLGTDLVFVDPDRDRTKPHHHGLRLVLERCLHDSPQTLVILVFEERGALKLKYLGDLFVPLLQAGAAVWGCQADPHFTKTNSCCVCLYGAASGEPQAFTEWKSIVGSETFWQIEEKSFRRPRIRRGDR